MTPTRLLDTRENATTFDGFDQAVGRLNANSTYELNIAGRAGITQGAVAAVINMVAVNPAAPGYLTVWPCSDSKPLAAALNYETGENNANEFSIAIGKAGDICIYAHSATDVVVDVYGYYMASSGTGEQGPTGPQGATGPQGPPGTGITVKGSTGEAGQPSFDGAETGDVWIDTNNEAWVWTDQDAWDDAGNIQGPAGADGANGQDGAQGPEGPQGPVGTGIAAKGSLEYVGPPTDKDNPESGDVWIDTADDAWVWTDEGEWDNVGNIAGPPGKDGATGSKGDQGDTGPQGLPGADAASPARVIWVAESGGDYTKLSAALDSITDSAADKPYVIKIAPGTYTETAHVAMKNYVDVEGSGQDITTIKCACSKGSVGSSAAVISAIGITAEIRHLTINNTGGGTNNYGIGLWAAQGSFSMLHVTATATGGGKNNYGVYYSASDSTMNNVTATATGGTQSNYGVYNERSDSTMNNVTATATGGTISTSGVYTKNLSSPTMNNMTITATGGTYNYGLHVDNESKPTIRNSSITALNPIITIAGVQVKVANTTLVGFKTGPADTYKCVGAMDADFNELSATCG